MSPAAAVMKRLETIKPRIAKTLQNARQKHRHRKTKLASPPTKENLEESIAALTLAIGAVDKKLTRLMPLAKHRDFIEELHYMKKKLPLLEQRHVLYKQRLQLQKQLRKLS